MTQAQAKEVTPIPTKGAVFYTDGGVRPTNPGHAGWGMHGYTYAFDDPKKGSGNQWYALTSEGYKKKSKNTLPDVKPLNYFNGYGTISDLVTNNVAELVASTWALNYAKQHAPKEVTIITDSEMVVKGVQSYIAKWENNGWLKSDGRPVSNQDYWRGLKTAITDLEANGAKVDFQWIKAHEGHPGNTEADFLATLGVTYARSGMSRSQVDIDPPEGYWAPVERHPLLAGRFMYFISDAKLIKPGVYLVGNHGKDEDLIGWPLPDATYSVVEAKEPDEVLELVRNLHIESAGDNESFILADIASIHSKSKEILRHGEKAICRTNAVRQDFLLIDTTPLTKELRPPRVAMRLMDAFNILGECLAHYKHDVIKYAVTDITSKIYASEVVEAGTKKKKVEEIKLTIHPELDQNSVLELTANCPDGQAGVVQTHLRVNLGLDCCERNTLKKLEKHNPVVSLVVWMESTATVRYATIVESALGRVITCAIYSNAKLLAPVTPEVTFAQEAIAA